MGCKIIRRILITAVVICCSFPVRMTAQYVNHDSQYVFGLNPLLYNGKYYTYFLAPGTIGTPFIESREFVEGTATIRGVLFTGLKLNYDVYNQQLVLNYRDAIGAVSQIAISDAWLEEFTLGDMAFKVLQTSDTSRRIFRVIGSGPDLLLEYRTKSVAVDNQLGTKNFRFSNLKITRYLQTETNIKSFTGNKSFLSLFSGEKQLVIRAYLRENRIRIRKSGYQELLKLINYCNKY
jgi:hypothetical protein